VIRIAGRTCKSCGEWYPFAKLVKASNCLHGYQPLCKMCRNDERRIVRKPDRLTREQKDRRNARKRAHYRALVSCGVHWSDARRIA
jgi:hypothetical protein